MVSQAARIFLAALIAFAGAVSVTAKNLADYRAGDIAETDIVTPIAVDAVNPATTAARKAAEALKVPAIFCDFPRVATNAIAAVSPRPGDGSTGSSRPCRAGAVRTLSRRA